MSGVFVCLRCRTLLEQHQPCDCGSLNRPAPLAGDQGRDALLREVWGPDYHQRLRRAALAGGGGGLTAGLLAEVGFFTGCGLVQWGVEGSGSLLFGAAMIFGFSVACLMIYLGVSRARAWYDRRRNRVLARGGAKLPPPRGAVLQRGTVVRPTGEAATDHAVATQLQLTVKQHRVSDRMLIHGATPGFEVELDSGQLVRVPRGRVRIWADAHRVVEMQQEPVRSWLRQVDPARVVLLDAPDPIPFDTANAVMLRVGDRVELEDTFKAYADPRDHGADSPYRAAAQSVLVPEEVPRIRVL